MANLQGDMQASIRALTGTALDFNGDFIALFDLEGIAAGDFNGRMLAWANARNGTNYPDLMGALNAYAVTLGYDVWNDVDNIPASGGGPPSGSLLWNGNAIIWNGGNLIWT